MFSLLKISENKTRQIIEPQPPGALKWESLGIMWKHIWPLQHWLTGCVSEKERWAAWITASAVIQFCWRHSGKPPWATCCYVILLYFGTQKWENFHGTKKRAGSWLWLTAQNIETIIHWDHLCKKRNPEIFSPWGLSCKRLLLFVLILVCKFSFSFSLLPRVQTINNKLKKSCPETIPTFAAQ